MTKSDKTTCVLISGEAEDLSEILDYLKYSEIDAESTCDEESGICSLTVPADQYEKASALLNIYQEEESEKQEDAAPSDTRTFVGSEEKYRDNASSAWSFLAVGLLVAVLLGLCSAGILPLPLTWSEQPMMFLVLCVLAVVFVAVGIYSYQKAEQYKKQMKEEISLESEITCWFLDNYSEESIDREIESEEGTLPQEEILCLKRMEAIRSHLKAQYPDLEDGHADSLSETLYQDLYEG